MGVERMFKISQFGIFREPLTSVQNIQSNFVDMKKIGRVTYMLQYRSSGEKMH